MPLISLDRIAALEACAPSNPDFKKLVRFCDELNASYAQGCHLAVAMLTRAIFDHVPPVFGRQTFLEVANQYKSVSALNSIRCWQKS